MKVVAARWVLLVPALLAVNAALAGESPLVFRDVAQEVGLYPGLAGIAGHGAGWGDVDGDGWPELYVPTFAASPYGSKDNLFFRSIRGKFRLMDLKLLQVRGRGNGAFFADFDNDGDLDLYVTNHSIAPQQPDQQHFPAPNYLFRNDGPGKFTDVSQRSGACGPGYASRSAAVLDFDGDERLDLLVGECFFQGGTSRSRLYRNLGDLRFENVTAKIGLPEHVTGFGVAAGDVNNDGWPDLFMAGRNGGNRLFVSDGKGRFREFPRERGNFEWAYTDTKEDTTCGVCFGDVDLDGYQDIVIGAHFDRPWYTGGVSPRLYLNRSKSKGGLFFEDVTERAGLIPLPLKSPHVEVQDFDNDGRPDIYTTIVLFGRGGRPVPAIFRGLGVKDGLPRFRTDARGVNDFPTSEDRKMADVTAFFEKMVRERKAIYMSPGPTCDFDRDGRLDMFLPNWWVNSRSLLLHNETTGGHWLDVAVQVPSVNPMGIGSIVRLYSRDEARTLLGCREIAVGFGYSSGQEAVAHFGLGSVETCDLEITLPHGKGRITREAVKADQRLVITEVTEPEPPAEATVADPAPVEPPVADPPADGT